MEFVVGLLFLVLIVFIWYMYKMHKMLSSVLDSYDDIG